jgi:hypothetical protein
MQRTHRNRKVPFQGVVTIPVVALRMITGKVKVKLGLLTAYHAMKAYWESGGIAPRIL